MKSSQYLFPTTSAALTPQPKGSIQFSSPYKPRQFTPKANLQGSTLHPPLNIQSNKTSKLSFKDIGSMAKSSIFFNKPSNDDKEKGRIQQKLEFHNMKNVRNQPTTLSKLAKYTTPVFASQQPAFERKVSNPYSIKVVSQSLIPLQQQKLSFNPELRKPEPQQKPKLDFSPLRTNTRNKSPRHAQPHSINHFKLGKRLGKGNFGQVFLAHHTTLNFIFALKIVSKKVLRQKKMEKQLLWQCIIQMTLDHPNIVGLYGIFYDKENIYLIQELITDGHLFTQMKYIKQYPEPEAANIIKQISAGVEYMHRMEIIHRDLKPQNILIQLGIHKICDFGWAVFSPNSLRSTFCGTPLYMSPEIIKRELYDEGVDNWALGVLTYELLVGRAPFRINKEQELGKIVSEEIKFPEYLEVSVCAKEFVMKLLDKEKEKRMELDVVIEHPFVRQLNQKAREEQKEESKQANEEFDEKQWKEWW